MIPSHRALGRVVVWLGTGIGLAVAAALPAGYLLVAWSQLGQELALLSEIKAARLAKYIYLHQELWQYHTLRLSELIEVPEARDWPYAQRVVDAVGMLVLETGDTISSPALRRTAAIVVGRAQAGTVETASSLWPILLHTGLVAALGALLGFAVYFAIRTFPLRIIDRILGELQSTQARLLATIEALPIEYMEFDKDGRLILINNAARISQDWSATAIGKTQREMLEGTRAVRKDADPQHDWDTWMEKCLATLGQTGSFELTRPTGEAGRFFVTDMPGGGQVMLRVDITESRQREAELAATQARYRLLFEANPLPMALIVIETDRFLAINEAAVMQYGWSREDFLAMTSAELYPPEDIPALLAQRQRTDLAGVIHTVRGLRHRRKDGSLMTVEMTIRPFKFEGVPTLLVMSQDVTERDRAEKARLVVEEQLRQSQKMEAVGQLTGGVAHDFNNILMVILGNLEMMEEDAAMPPHLRKVILSIGRATDRAAKLTHQLLAYSRQQVLRPQHIDINTAVTAIVSLLRRTLGAHIEIDLALSAEPAMVEIDRSQMEAALLNLALNARDAMPEGGTLRLSSANRTIAATDGAAAGNYIVIEVTDSGSGIAPENHTRIFEPFFTTKEVGKGSGLGLSMVFGFLQQSGGFITVRSDIGQGTKFSLHLPQAVTIGETKTESVNSPPTGNEHILVVEDEDEVRAAVLGMLGSLGYSATGVDSGSAALQALQTGAHPDLVLTDLIMPGSVSGARLAEEVKLRWRGVHLAFMTGYSDLESFELDASIPLLVKPFRKHELARHVRRALADEVN